MALPRTHSLAGSLDQGMVDGSYKQINPDRGGEVEATTEETRKDLSPRLYGITEAVVKTTPMGDKVRTGLAVEGFDIPRIDHRS